MSITSQFANNLKNYELAVIRLLSKKFNFQFEDAKAFIDRTYTPKTPELPSSTPVKNPQHEALFKQIQVKIEAQFTSDFIKTLKTQQGNTQKKERVGISKFKEVFDAMGLTYEEAGTQQSKDFRNIGGTGLNIEAKKTDSTTIVFNDTCPVANIYYIIVFTGKECKRKTEKNIPPQLLFLNGEVFLDDTDPDVLAAYKEELEYLKDTYARGKNKKFTGKLAVYPRPTYRGDISSFLVK